MKLDFSKSAKSNIIKLIKRNNNLFIDEAALELTDLKSIPGVALPNPKTPSIINGDDRGLNTSLIIKAKEGSETVSGRIEIRYRRISLRRQWAAMHGGYTDATLDNFIPTYKIHKAQIAAFTEENVIDYIYEKFPYIKESVDVTTEVGDNVITVNYLPKENDPIYVRDQVPFSVKVHLIIEVLDLSKIITRTELQGFDYETSLELASIRVHGITYTNK